jgi:RHS repeat-associated protein
MVWSLADRLGSIDVLVNEQGIIVGQRTYDSFGNTLSQLDSNVKFRFGYTGRESDPETGLYYYRARYFDANVGRFISTDPIGFEAGDSNLYRYVNNSSTLATDPTGEFLLPLLGIIAIGALFGAAFNVIHQDLRIIEGSRKEFDWGEFAASTVAGAVLAPAFILAPELIVPASIWGAYNGFKSISEGRVLSGSFEVLSSVLPFASKSVRQDVFGEKSLFNVFNWQSRSIGNISITAGRDGGLPKDEKSGLTRI